MGYRIVTPPLCEPVTLSETRLYLRINDGDRDDDELITQLITAARQHVEGRMRRQIVQATLELTLDQFPVARIAEDSPNHPYSDLPGRRTAVERTTGIRLPHPPLISVTKIEYVDGNGTTQTLSSSAYVVDAKNEPGIIMQAYNALWPVCRSQPSAVTVTYVAGYGVITDTTDAQKQAAVPAAVKLAIKMLVRHWYDYRGVSGEAKPETIPEGFDALIGLHGYGSYYE